jgi:hypothetical protein
MTTDVYAKATDQSKRAAIDSLPFAKAKTPDHILTMQDAHKSVTVNSKESFETVKQGVS